MGSPKMLDKLGDYTLLERIGRGGMGVVYRARHDERGEVAIKLMPDASRDARGRLLREAGLAASLSHPRIIKVYGLGEHRRQPYIVMELLDGITLTEVMRSHPRPGLERRLALMKQILEALAHAHEAGVTHRDVKPQNIFVTRDGNVRVLDFGLASANDSMSREADHLAGTPAYMSPEQARRDEVDFRGDIFSVGTVFYELLSGARAFGGGEVREVLERVEKHEPVAVHRIDERLPEGISTIVRTAMAKDPDDRYASMREMLGAVERFEGTLAALRERLVEEISAWLDRLGTPRVDPGPLELYIPTELPSGYLELLALRRRMDEQREPFEELVRELEWVSEMLTAELQALDVDTLRGVANRADCIRELWPAEPRVGKLGRRVLDELRTRLPLREPVDWGNAGQRPGSGIS